MLVILKALIIGVSSRRSVLQKPYCIIIIFTIKQLLFLLK